MDAIDPRDYGATLNGSTDDGTALKACFAAASATGLPIWIPGGKTLMFTAASVASTGVEFIPPANVLIYGDGPSSVLKFRRTNFPSAYGLSIQTTALHSVIAHTRLI